MKQLFLSTLIVISIVGDIAFAQRTYYAQKGFYVGLAIPYNTIKGDFDGKTYLTDGYVVALVPKVEGNYGWGILLGRRFKEWAIEVNYLRSNHDITWLGAKGKANYNMVNLDVKYYFLSEKSIQPFILYGFVIPWFVVKDSYYDFWGNSIKDATYKGIGLNFGTGLSFYLHPRIAIFGEVIYRWITYNSLKGYEIEDSLNGSGLNFNAGITFTF